MRVEGISEDKVCGPLERRLGVLDQTPNGTIRSIVGRTIRGRVLPVARQNRQLPGRQKVAGNI